MGLGRGMEMLIFRARFWAGHFTSANTSPRGGLIIPISETKDLKLRIQDPHEGPRLVGHRAGGLT